MDPMACLPPTASGPEQQEPHPTTDRTAGRADNAPRTAGAS